MEIVRYDIDNFRPRIHSIEFTTEMACFPRELSKVINGKLGSLRIVQDYLLDGIDFLVREEFLPEIYHDLGIRQISGEDVYSIDSVHAFYCDEKGPYYRKEKKISLKNTEVSMRLRLTRPSTRPQLKEKFGLTFKLTGEARPEMHSVNVKIARLFEKISEKIPTLIEPPTWYECTGYVGGKNLSLRDYIKGFTKRYRRPDRTYRFASLKEVREKIEESDRIRQRMMVERNQ